MESKKARAKRWDLDYRVANCYFGELLAFRDFMDNLRRLMDNSEQKNPDQILQDIKELEKGFVKEHAAIALRHFPELQK